MCTSWTLVAYYYLVCAYYNYFIFFRFGGNDSKGKITKTVGVTMSGAFFTHRALNIHNGRYTIYTQKIYIIQREHRLIQRASLQFISSYYAPSSRGSWGLVVVNDAAHRRQLYSINGGLPVHDHTGGNARKNKRQDN